MFDAGAVAVERVAAIALVHGAIPRRAVLWPGGTPRVFVRRAPDTYERREVKLGRSGDALWEVPDGVKKGEQVVTRAGVLLDGQAQMNSDANP